MKKQYSLSYTKRTELGGKETNEDRYFVYDRTIDKKPGTKMRYFIIADGVGKSSRNFSAAEEAIAEVRKYLNPLTHAKVSTGKIIDTVRTAIISANERILQANIARHGENIDNYDSTTLDVCIVHNRYFQVAHVGDSRVYVLYKDGQFKKITKDENKAQILFEKGKIKTEDEQKVHSSGGHLLNSVGAEKDFSPTVYEPILLESIAVILAGTDGFYKGSTEKEKEDTLLKYYHSAQFKRDGKKALDSVLQELFSLTDNSGMIQICMALNNIKDASIAHKNLINDNRTAILCKYTGGN